MKCHLRSLMFVVTYTNIVTYHGCRLFSFAKYSVVFILFKPMLLFALLFLFCKSVEITLLLSPASIPFSCIFFNRVQYGHYCRDEFFLLAWQNSHRLPLIKGALTIKTNCLAKRISLETSGYYKRPQRCLFPAIQLGPTLRCFL